MRNEKGQFVKGFLPPTRFQKGDLRLVGKPGGMLGKHQSEKTRKKISVSLSLVKKGKPQPWNAGEKNHFFGKKHSAESIAKRTANRIYAKGEFHYKWISDRTLLKDDHKDRGGQFHKEWSRSVKNRDGWTCKIANGDCSGRLEAHHILGWRSHPELRYKINNGITLCHFHHPRKRVEEERLSPYFKSLVELEAKSI